MKSLSSFLIVLAVLIGCSPKSTDVKEQTDPGPFLHGVASGDPLYDRVIIWTRVTPESPADSVVVFWEVSEDQWFKSSLISGQVVTDAGRDFTVKVDVANLQSGTPYYYRFKSAGSFSPIGRTKTAAQNADSLRFAVVSCSNYEWGYFTAYQKIAEKELLDAVVHLGDYIYEYAPGGYGDTTIGRKHEPPHELLTLSDYRTRYAQYRSDPDLQAMHASHPFIAIWDDHEIANDVYTSGAQNHQANEGSFEERKRAAVQTYYEWMPIREADKLYRSFEFGELAELIMLDERLEGRTAPVASISDENFNSPDRSMLGADQLSWLKSTIEGSEARWKVIGNQVIFSDINQTMVFPDNPKNLDSWDGYPAEKKEVARFIKDFDNILWVTGDTHASWVMETIVADVSLAPLGVEFGTPSISSANYDEYSGLDTARMYENLFQNFNPHIKYANLTEHGYFLLTLQKERATARYYFVENIRVPNAAEGKPKEFWVNDGAPVIKQYNVYGF